jgi:hypothetical protein
MKEKQGRSPKRKASKFIEPSISGMDIFVLHTRVCWGI